MDIKKFIKEKTATILKFVAVLIMGGILALGGQSVDWTKLAKDGFKGEVTDTAQEVENLQDSTEAP